MALSLLCIALPLRAIAVASGEHCPMMQAQMQPGAQQSGMHADTHAKMHAPLQADAGAMADTSVHAGSHDCCDGRDCCNDAATFASTGQLCKTGQQCSPTMTYLLPPAVLQAAIDTQHTVVTTLSPDIHTRPPAAVWRPPSQG